MAKQPPNDVSIGKFDILATYTFAHGLLAGHDEDEAKQRGMVAAVMGAQARLGVRKNSTRCSSSEAGRREAGKNGGISCGLFGSTPGAVATRHGRLGFARSETPHRVGEKSDAGPKDRPLGARES